MIIMGYFHAKTEICGENNLDSRGQKFIDLIFRHDLMISNNPNSAPTFNSHWYKLN